LFADFDTSVKRIIAQPFLLSAQVEATVRRHVPDFLLLADTEPTVVDVKPRLQLSKTKVSFTLAWTKDVVEQRGWRYEVWTEPPEAELGNLRFLAGFRRDWLIDRNLLDELRAADLQACRSGRHARASRTGPSRSCARRSSIYQAEYSRNLLFHSGALMEDLFDRPPELPPHRQHFADRRNASS
jgi:hypothetical protein